MLRFLRRVLIKDRRGGVMIEAAVIMPFILMVMLGGVEIVRFALLQQKLNRTAVSMADLVAQAETLTTADLDSLFVAVNFVTKPFDIGPNGRVIVSSISATGTAPPVIDWQRAGNGGNPSITSELGDAGEDAALPSGFIVRPGESVIFAEVVYDFEPFIFPQFLSAQRLRHRAMFRPRFGALSELQDPPPS
ncbi:MAG: pilus assembly protein [Alphaproteobacteria bacterium]|nr:pilus assembly protein [Alphaproteobacteria bacterium]